jgi:glucose-1-phosphate thymidylyltransferase
MNQSRNADPSRNVVGLIPAAGQATRLGPLPCSKEVYPVGLRPDPSGQGIHPRVVSQYLLEKMRFAGIGRGYIILREGKWDIPAYFRDGEIVGMRLAYLAVSATAGAPYTLDYAYPFVRDSIVALGFPDILFSPDDAYARLLAYQAASNADVVLGLFPADHPSTMDVAAVDDTGRVREIVIKPAKTDLTYTWGIAVWTPAFTEFMHEYLRPTRTTAAQQPEKHVGDVIQAAIVRGMNVQAVRVSDVPFLDIGTPGNLARVSEYLAGVPRTPRD